MEFSHELAIALVRSEDEFPVDFDDAWQWIGYSTKQKAKNKLLNNFESGVDYLSLNQTVKREIGGTTRELIRLTIDCFKSLSMMAGTEKGKKVRRYFLKCEQQLKQVLSQPPLLPSPQDRITLLQQTIECGARHLGWDARDLLFWRDQLKNAAVAMTQPLLPAASGDPEQRMELPISDRALQLGYRPNQNQLLSIGQLAARMYRKMRGCAPPKREQWVSGTTRLVNVYTPNDAAILDEAIQTVMREAN